MAQVTKCEKGLILLPVDESCFSAFETSETKIAELKAPHTWT
jgi:hypothetical protein